MKLQHLPDSTFLMLIEWPTMNDHPTRKSYHKLQPCPIQEVVSISQPISLQLLFLEQHKLIDLLVFDLVLEVPFYPPFHLVSMEVYQAPQMLMESCILEVFVLNILS